MVKKMNKKGFTLVELLAVIIILSIIVIIAIPSIMGISKSIKENMYNKKIAIIEEAAILYGQDNRRDINLSEQKYNTSYNCINIKVNKLLPVYLDSDDTYSACKNNSKCVVNPKDKNSYLDNENIIIYMRRDRVSAVMKAEDNCS